MPWAWFVQRIADLGGAVPTPTPPPSPYRVFLPAMGAPAAGEAPGASAAWVRFLESPWIYLALGVLVGAWLALRALERGRRAGR